MISGLVFKTRSFRDYFRWTLISLLIGVLAGTATAVFLFTLHWATATRDGLPVIIWALPLAGLFIGWIYHRYGKGVVAGNNLILDEIHDPKKVVPLRMAPLILFSTVLTHLFGGSAGREGTAVQMGASLADQISKFLKLTSEDRKTLLAAGAGAGFGAAIGAPWAGAIFGMEVIHAGKIKAYAWYECLIASMTAYSVVVFVGPAHAQFLPPVIVNYALQTFLYVALAGAIFGLTAMLFVRTTHAIESLANHHIQYPPLRPFIGGLLLVALFYIEGSYKYVGLGIPQIQDGLVFAGGFLQPLFKAGFTALTIGTGFKGGEFIPLVFIGTTLGNALSMILPISFSLLAAVGFAAVFAGAANTPIACTLMAIEIFGWSIGPYALLGCFMSFWFSGSKGIYKTQKARRTTALIK